MKYKKAFTLLEVLLVVAIIAILVSIVILAINPAKQFGDTRNSQRRLDVVTILNAVYQYAVDNNGALPSSVTTSVKSICRQGATVTTTCADLSTLTNNEKYLVSIPSDPSGVTGQNSNYNIIRTANGRITISAPNAEQGAVITFTR